MMCNDRLIARIQCHMIGSSTIIGRNNDHFILRMSVGPPWIISFWTWSHNQRQQGYAQAPVIIEGISTY